MGSNETSQYKVTGSNHFTPCISCAGGVFMCRRQHLLGCVMLGFGIGLMIGHCLTSGFLCLCGGMVFVILGFGGMRRR